MNLFGKKGDEEREEEVRHATRKKKTEELPKDSTRWLSILFLLIFLFISYLSWASFQAK